MKISRELSAQPIITDLELFDSLSEYSQTTRVAMLLILSTDLSPEKVIYLTWKGVKAMSLGRDAVTLLNALPRQLFGDLVFWEELNGEIALLFNLCEDLDRLLGVFTLDEFRELYKNMIYVEASSKKFIRQLSLEIFSRG